MNTSFVPFLSLSVDLAVSATLDRLVTALSGAGRVPDLALTREDGGDGSRARWMLGGGGGGLPGVLDLNVPQEVTSEGAPASDLSSVDKAVSATLEKLVTTLALSTEVQALTLEAGGGGIRGRGVHGGGGGSRGWGGGLPWRLDAAV